MKNVFCTYTCSYAQSLKVPHFCASQRFQEAAAVRKFRPAHDVSDILGSFKETTEDHKSGLKQVAATIQTENVFTYDLPTRRTKGLERSVLRGGSSPGTSREYSNITVGERRVNAMWCMSVNMLRARLPCAA